MHARKIKALMTSINQLKGQVATLTEQTKSHAVAKTVQKAERRLREQELVSDVLKGMLESSAGMSREEVRPLERFRAVPCIFQRARCMFQIDRQVIMKTIGGPKRFRPKTREEMTLEVRALRFRAHF